MLTTANPVAFVATANPEAAKRFYRDTLGLKFVEDSPFAIVFDMNGVMLRIAKMQQIVVVPYTVLGWNTNDIAAEMRDLSSRGVHFERYPGLPQDANGVWTTPDGARVAWFKDPDGNTLSIGQGPKKS